MSRPVQLVVIAAFDPDPETGDLLQAIEPIQADNTERALRMAKELAGKHAGVIAWSRSAEPDVGEYGEPEVIFQSGTVPEME